jgi:hypothetical protein
VPSDQEDKEMSNTRGFQFEVAATLQQAPLFDSPEWSEANGLRMYHLMRLEHMEDLLARVFARSKAVLGDDTWLELMEHFHVSWPCVGHPTAELMDEFVKFVQALPEVDDVPVWLAELARFEWVLWSVQTQTRQRIHVAADQNWLDAHLAVNPTLREASFDWSVHEISPLFLPQEPMRTVLWVLRDDSDDAQVVRGDLFGSQLLGLIRQGLTPRQALSSMAHWFGHEQPQAFIEEAASVIDRLMQDKILMLAKV